jgi:hypothetical protein
MLQVGATRKEGERETGPFSSNYKRKSRQTHRQQGDLISLILFFQNEEHGLQSNIKSHEDLRRSGRVTDPIPRSASLSGRFTLWE